MTGREFAEHFQYLEDNCADLPEKKRANRMDAFRRYWEPFKPEVFKRAILWYLEHAPDENPFFPTLGQVVAAQDASKVPAEARPEPTPTEAERADMARFLESPEYKALLKFHGLSDE